MDAEKEELVTSDGLAAEVSARPVEPDPGWVAFALRRKHVGFIGGYLRSDEARALAALLVKHADRAEGK